MNNNKTRLDAQLYKTTGNQLDLFIYKTISNFSGDFTVSATEVQAALAENKQAKKVVVHINSPGGNFYEGVTIYNLLRNLNTKVKIIIEGFAGSIASVIALAGDEVVICKGAQIYLHKPITSVYGNTEDLEEAIRYLKKVFDSAVEIYSTRTGLADEKIISLCEDETFLTSSEAVELGFAKKVIEDKKISACFDTKLLADCQDVSKKAKSYFSEMFSSAQNNSQTQIAESSANLKISESKETQMNEKEIRAEATSAEQDRCAQLIKTFNQPHHTELLTKAIETGMTLNEAKVAAFDIGLSVNAPELVSKQAKTSAELKAEKVKLEKENQVLKDAALSGAGNVPDQSATTDSEMEQQTQADMFNQEYAALLEKGLSKTAAVTKAQSKYPEGYRQSILAAK